MTWLRVVHVVTATVYVGRGHIVENLLLYRSENVGGRSQVFRAIRAGVPAIDVAPPIMILSGVAMVMLDDAWSFTSPFVIVGVAAVVTSAIVGIPILREVKSLEKLICEHGEPDAVRRRYRRLSTGWSGLAVVYLTAVWAMAYKP